LIQKEIEASQSAVQRAQRWEARLTETQIATARRRVERITETTVLRRLDASHLSAKTVRNMLKQDLLEDDEVWVCLADRRNILLATSSPAHDAEQLLAPFRRKWKMRGAGASRLAQGGPVPEDIEDPLEEVAISLLEFDRITSEFAPPTPS
jgi:alanyl-tRNA synthetase